MKYSKTVLLFCIFLITSAGSFAQPITLVPFSSGFSSPVDIKSCGDDRLFIVEQAGYIRIVDTLGVQYPSPFLNIQSRVSCCGERGLLGLAFDPDFKNNKFIYVNYTAQTHGDTRISRFRVSDTNPDSVDAASEQVLITIWQPYANHNGGHLAFSPIDNYLYVGTGDGGSGGDPGNRSQNIDSLLGKMLRLDVSDTSVAYIIPDGNPLVGVAGADEIWHIGLRNPWRFSFDRWNGDMWIGDVGQNQWEEVDYQPASSPGGENWGWRCYEGNHNYNTTGCGPMSNYDAPVYEYNNNGAAVVGGYRYRGAEYSNMYPKYFFTDEFTTTYQFRALTSDGAGGWTDSLMTPMGRSIVVTFGEDRWGELYCSDYSNGGIYKFVGESCLPVASINEGDSISVCDTLNPYVLRTPDGKGFTYEWFRNGSTVGNNNDTLLITSGGTYSVVATNPSGCSATSTDMEVIFNGPPAVSFTGLDTFYCVFHAQDTLTGLPLGGQFSGPGLSGPINRFFNPASAGIGDHTITYSYTDPVTGCTGTSSQLVHVDLCTGVNEQAAFHRLDIYPNPNKGSFTCSFYTFPDEDVSIEVSDVTGRIAYSETLHVEQGNQSVKINLHSLQVGVYLLKAINSKGSSGKHFVVE